MNKSCVCLEESVWPHTHRVLEIQQEEMETRVIELRYKSTNASALLVHRLGGHCEAQLNNY